MLRKKFIDYLYIAAGSFLIAVGVNFFLVPCKISTGGVSGVGMVLYHLFGIPLSVTTLAINAVLFFFGYQTLRGEAVAKTVAGIVFLSLFLEITGRFGSYQEDLLISSVFGGILTGVGVGLTVLKNASTGGSDFAALMLHRLIPHISVANFLLLIDSLVILASGIVFKNYTIMFYSVISVYIGSKVTDFLLVQGEYAKSVYVISKKSEEIADWVMTELERGVTGIYSKGLYHKVDGMMLLCIVRSKEIPKLISKIKELDADAFTVISEVREVHGEGFKKA